MAVRKPATQPARPSWHDLADQLGPQRARRSTAPGVARAIINENAYCACDKCGKRATAAKPVIIYTNGAAFCRDCKGGKQ